MTNAPNQDLPGDQPRPDNTLPGDLPVEEVDVDETERPGKTPPGQDPNKIRGKSADAPGQNKPEPR
jgi:hypothetical protein